MWSISTPPQLRRGAGAAAAFVQVAAAISEDIRRGVLRSGDRLPSTRVLAGQLAVNRNTIVAAYDELIAQGWAVTRGPGGTFVCEALPERAARRALPAASQGIAARPGFEMRSPGAPQAAFAPPGARYHMSMGVPDTRLLPTAMLARAYRRALRSRVGRTRLDYGAPSGEPRLRAALAAMLRATRGIPAGPENILITRGSQMGIDLAARLLVRPGEVVAVEQLGYRPAWRAFEAAGARLVPIALDGDGLVVEALPDPAPRCVYVTPHHQYPTTVLMSQARRMALLQRAQRDRFAILEDDYDHEFHFDGRPVAPLAAADTGGNVLYLGTLSKTLAPGLRIGFVAAAERTIEALARLLVAVDRHGDQVLEYAVADLIEDGELLRHTRKMRRVYAARRDALASVLARELGGVLRFELPAGGMTLWARVDGRGLPPAGSAAGGQRGLIDDSVKLEAWRDRALARGVAFVTAKDFALDGRPRPFLRLSYAHYDEAELADAVRRMRRALDDR